MNFCKLKSEKSLFQTDYEIYSLKSHNNMAQNWKVKKYLNKLLNSKIIKCKKKNDIFCLLFVSKNKHF